MGQRALVLRAHAHARENTVSGPVDTVMVVGPVVADSVVCMADGGRVRRRERAGLPDSRSGIREP
jgi:hypothetical protein